MYRIGEFSILNSVTIKTLRYYDEIGLFKPKIVDNFTGYRYYDDTQLDEFNEILNYKSLGFSLDEIKDLKSNNENEILKNKIKELTIDNAENIKKINTLKSMLGECNMVEVKFRGFDEGYIIGKRIALENRDKVKEELKIIKEELDKLDIKYYENIIQICNFELGYENNNIDVFIGYKISDNEVNKIDTVGDYNSIENTELEIMYKSKTENFLIAKCNKENLDDAYKRIIEYAHLNNIQIKGWFSEIYEDNKVTLYVPAFDLNEINDDEVYSLEKFNNNLNEVLDINKKYVGTYKIREILPSIKYMFNPNKQKSMLDTKYSTITLNENGSTNFENIRWNNDKLLLNYNNITIPLNVYIENINEKEYIIVLMNETYDNYKSQRPLCYLYEKISNR